MKSDILITPAPPLDGPAVQKLEEALLKSPKKSIYLSIGQALYLLTREGRWFRFSLLTKKRTIKKSQIYHTLTDFYNEAVHGCSWTIAEIVT